MNIQQSKSQMFQLCFNSQCQQSLSYKQNSDPNKDSVNTSIGDDHKIQLKKYQINNDQNKINCFLNKKTKIILKKQTKVVAPILKHRQVIQTLRNITKNIKNQIGVRQISSNTSNKYKQLIKDKIQEKIQPQINHIQRQDFEITQKLNLVYKPNQQIIESNINEIDKNNNEMIEQEVQNNCKQFKMDKIVQSVQKSKINIRKYENVLLYSKYKGVVQSFPVFEDRQLTDKKQLRNLTINRQLDNDVQSDDEQIQMSVGYMYYELMNSCHKNTQLRRQKQERQKMKYVNMGQNRVNRNNNNRNGEQVPLQRVRQKLIFK